MDAGPQPPAHSYAVALLRSCFVPFRPAPRYGKQISTHNLTHRAVVWSRCVRNVAPSPRGTLSQGAAAASHYAGIRGGRAGGRGGGAARFLSLPRPCPPVPGCAAVPTHIHHAREPSSVCCPASQQLAACSEGRGTTRARSAHPLRLPLHVVAWRPSGEGGQRGGRQLIQAARRRATRPSPPEGLPSAAALVRGAAGCLRDGQRRELLGDGGVDTHRRGEGLVRGA